MNKQHADYLKAKFEEIVNNQVTMRYETDIKVNVNDSSVVDYFVIKAQSLIWHNDWMIMESFAFLMHMCICYDVENKEWHLW